MDGWFSVVAGHIEAGESAASAMVREAKEEAGLSLNVSELSLFHIVHRLADEERYSFFFLAEQWAGEPTNMEPDKCDQLDWYSVQSLPKNTIPYVKHAIALGLEGIRYSEMGWDSEHDA